MSIKITRSDEFVKDERGPDWFQDFLRSFSQAKTSGIQDILDIINDRQHKSVETLVKSYRDQVGLDLIGTDEDEEEITKNAEEHKEELEINDLDGINYVGKEEKERAQKADLITLPKDVEGTNCSNCMFIKDVKDGKGFCNHPDIQLKVSARMCCALWKNKEQQNSWETPEQKCISIRASALGPISPMKLKKVEDLDSVLKDHKPEDLIVQVKFDGWKCQSIKSGGKVRLFSRRGDEITENIPELVEQLDKVMSDGSFILGELVWEDKNGKQSISDIQTVAGSSPEKAHEKIKAGGGKVIFYVYDILWKNSKDITGQKYIDRYNILKQAVGKQSNIKVAENYTWDKKDSAMKDAVSMGGEGIVIKPKDSEYKYATKGQNEPVGEWYKYKKGVKSHTDEVVLNKYHKDTDKLVFPAYQYKGKELVEVGNLSGMSKEDEAKIKKDIDAGKSIVVEVTYQERMPSGKFRHMGWSRFRTDKPVKEVKMASSETTRDGMKKLSKRHIIAEPESIITVITNNPELKDAIDSFCMHSGGTKSTHSIIQFLQEKLGKELVKFTDENLIKYIEERKKNNKHHDGKDVLDVGKVGIDAHDEYEDNVADYVQHGGTMK